MNFYDDIGVYGDSTALITESSGNISYSELLGNADALRESFKGRSLVFSLSDNCVESVVGYIGFLRARVVPYLINSNISIELFDNLLQTYKPEYIWLHRGKAATLDGCTEVYSYRNYVLLKTSFVVDYELHDDLALLLTTSGITGSPKLVRLSYKNITANACSIAQYLGISETDRPITTLPMNYSYGLSIINSHLLKGCATIQTNKTLIDKAFWELLKSNDATTFGGVPYLYEMLKRLRFSRMGLPSLKILTQAGGKLSQVISEEFAKICEQKGIDFVVMYGQTEATARMSYLPARYAVSKAGGIGIAIPGGEFWIEDENGNLILENDTAGELAYKGDNVSMGYAVSCYDLCKGDENGGILRTGDEAKRDSDGFYYIVGRKKRFLKLFGSKVNLDEIEHMLNAEGYNCVCAGEDDNLKIYITDIEEQNEVKTFIAGRTEINQSAFSVTFIEEIPRNESGKIIYSALD